MASSEGFWLNLHSGKWWQVRDHASDVKLYPQRYGVKPKEVANLDPSRVEDYDTLRLLAVLRGWARLRTSSGGVVVEFYFSPLDDVVVALAAFLQARGFGPLTPIALHDLKTHKEYDTTLQGLLDSELRLQTFGFGEAVRRRLRAAVRRATSVRESAARLYRGLST